MKRQLLAALSIFVCVFAKAQPIDTTLARYASSYQPEKAYLHFDKAAYSPGETVWFKAYLMEALFPSEGSKTIYVDWVADDGTVLSHSVSPLVESASSGQFEVPENYTGQFIHVRAYTKWMLNFDTAFLFSKDLRILSKTPAANGSRSSAPQPQLNFFPEGGDLISGLVNTVAFKANDQWGRPVRIKGLLLDSKGAIVDSVRTIHDGMGFFYFNPAAGNTYTLKWKDDKGTERTSPLPAAKPAGVAMRVSLNGTRRIVSISNAGNIPGNLKTIHLVGTMNQNMVFKTEVSFAEGNAVRKIIPTEGLPSGILTMTLFDSDWNAIAERISFVNNNDYAFQPSMEVERWGLSKRKRNEIRLVLPDSLAGASLSVSVTDAGIERDTTETIISHFLLSSDIKGKVYNPAYYFSSNHDSVARHLDLVMLTNGWRRFKWEDVTKGKMPAITYQKDTDYLSLSGQVYGVSKSQLSGKETIVLLVKEKDTSTKMLMLPINTDGSFSDPNVIFFDTLQVYYSLKSKFLKQAEARFMTDRLPPPNYGGFIKNLGLRSSSGDTTGSARHALLAAEALRLQGNLKGKMLDAVTVTAKQKTPVQAMDERYTSAMFRGGDGYQFDLVNDPSAIGTLNVFNYLQGRVAGLQISNAGGSEPTLSWRGGAPQLYLDEIPTDGSMLSGIPMSDVAYIKVFRPPFMGGFNGANGAIVIYTRKGNDAQSRPGEGLASNKISGYTPIRQFFSPNYDSFDPRNEQKDVRTTLYWNPVVKTTAANRTVTLSFYNNDVSQSFRVVVEGISKNGLLTHFEQIME
ncbi:MAG TPA: hypothetical protein VFR58_13580 [Flavisolibacter sp.]|nr:hypothetical protein [Flavisolibacter sp.]